MLVQHYKGGMYSVLHRNVTHEATGELMVVYISHADGRLWTRSQAQFDEEIYNGGELVKRFMPVG